MKNIINPRAVSFEDALRNLAAKLTGKPVNELPRTQESVVQYMAENVPSVDQMTETVTQEVMNRLAQAAADGGAGEQEIHAEDGGTFDDEYTANSQENSEILEQNAADNAGSQSKSRKSK